jgi:NADH dehydrogenase
VVVEKDYSIKDHPEVFVIGDLAHCVDSNGVEVPGLAPAALQAGKHAGTQIWRSIDGKPREDFAYLDKGAMATIGRSSAVAVSGKLKMRGLIAWLAWIFIHILFLVGFRNRIAVMFEWAWAYFTFQRSARVILTNPRPKTVSSEQ